MHSFFLSVFSRLSLVISSHHRRRARQLSLFITSFQRLRFHGVSVRHPAIHAVAPPPPDPSQHRPAKSTSHMKKKQYWSQALASSSKEENLLQTGLRFSLHPATSRAYHTFSIKYSQPFTVHTSIQFTGKAIVLTSITKYYLVLMFCCFRLGCLSRFQGVKSCFPWLHLAIFELPKSDSLPLVSISHGGTRCHDLAFEC